MRLRNRLVYTLLVFASSCNVMGRACTLMGCESGTVVNLQGAPQGPWTISVSAQGTTMTKDCAAGGNCGGMMFFENFLHDLVTVTVTRNGTSVTHQNLAPSKTSFQPNGPGCGPTCDHRVLTVSPP